MATSDDNDKATEPAPEDTDAASEPEQAGDDKRDDGEDKFFIVGVGASAGGLDALSALLRHLDLDGMAMVVVQHLAPRHDSVLPALLTRASHSKVMAAADGMKVQPGHIYVIPPNADLAILQGVLHLMPVGTSQSGLRLPVDYFLRSLAEDQGARAIGVVLSGTGTDGTFGLKAIKEAGGITFVQDPSTAKYDGMPRHALESGFADFCLASEAIAEELMSIAKHYICAATGGGFRDCKVRVNIASQPERTVLVSGSRIPPLGGETVLILLAFEDRLRPT
jgi:chemotaxis response regulator CheB